MDPMKKKFPFPKHYWKLVAASGAMLLFSIIYILITIFVIHEGIPDLFPSGRQHLAVGFVLTLLALWGWAFFFARRAGALSKKRDAQIQAYYAQFKYCGIAAEDCAFLWFTRKGDTRALVSRDGDSLLLRVQDFSAEDETWRDRQPAQAFSSLEEIKKSLADEYNFHYPQNQALKDGTD